MAYHSLWIGALGFRETTNAANIAKGIGKSRSRGERRSAASPEPTLALWKLLVLREDLILAEGGPLDLVSLNEAPIPLAFEVADSGICLAASQPELDAEWRCRARMRYLDFKPFLDCQWQILGERLHTAGA